MFVCVPFHDVINGVIEWTKRSFKTVVYTKQKCRRSFEEKLGNGFKKHAADNASHNTHPPYIILEVILACH